MKEEKIPIEDLKVRNNHSKKSASFGGSLSKDFNKQNEKVIKLIRQKMYPLHFSQRSALIFPKIKQKTYVKKTNDLKLKKTYIEITLDDQEERKVFSKHKTVIEEEMMLRIRMNKAEKAQRMKKRDDKMTSLLSKYQRKIQRCIKKIQDNKVNHFQSNNQKIQSATSSIMLQQRGLHAEFLKNEGVRIMTEQVSHQNLLKRIKDEIHKQRNEFINGINFTELIQKPVNKQKFSIEYLVKSLDSRQKREFMYDSPLVGYEDVSPNKLGKFVSMFSKGEELKSFESEKDKGSNENSKSLSMFRQINRNKTTILQQENDIELENIISAKYRMKTNHKKLIEIARSKNNQ